MLERIEKYGLKVDKKLVEFIENEVLQGIDVSSEHLWKSFSEFLTALSKKNKDLLEHRIVLKKQIDNWHLERKGSEIDENEYKSFLESINYLVPEGDPFKIDTPDTDEEIAHICGPQLVVPITNARYALNAANARWGSLYDALYGTDAMGSLPEKGDYNHERGSKVINYAKLHLDKIFPLEEANWADIDKLEVNDNLLLILSKGEEKTLVDSSAYVGYIKSSNDILSEVILEKNNLKVRIIIDYEDEIGSKDKAGISDIYVESAISTIMDCEDSVATVDGEDKVLAYRNWLGLMRGDLSAKFSKNDNIVERKLRNDIEIVTKEGKKIKLKGRSLMLIRNVGHLMTNPAILMSDGSEVYEGLMDALITSLIALHDFKEKNIRNSTCNSIYIVKPKMHGPDEVMFADEIFGKVETILNLPLNTIKIGIMDEERRTSVNLFECIRAAKSRVAFINTGFLDRTGDEIHTSTEAGPFLKKGDMKATKWIKSYEDRNVDIGLECGLQGKAQIGKGMWAMPDLMKDMLDVKIGHVQAGASCAWVPSPTAATLHALHYHEVSVKSVQDQLILGGRRGKLDELLTIPLSKENWNQQDITRELENNAQSILGYVVRWVDQGVGCSKVPDINDVGLMEDRATCRISSQILANWLKHNVIEEEQVKEVMKKMALKVDNQNKNDDNYKPMSENLEGVAFNAALRLVLEGSTQPSGYTEPILHEMRLKLKNEA